MDADRLLKQTHRFFAVETNNAAWNAMDAGDEAVLELAWSSLFHWRAAGTALNVARAHGTVSRAYCAAGEGKLALAHVDRYAEAEGSEGWEAWDKYFVLSARARALTLVGDPTAAQNKESAKAVAEGLEGEDRDICLRDWATIP